MSSFSQVCFLLSVLGFASVCSYHMLDDEIMAAASNRCSIPLEMEMASEEDLKFVKRIVVRVDRLEDQVMKMKDLQVEQNGKILEAFNSIHDRFNVLEQQFNSVDAKIDQLQSNVASIKDDLSIVKFKVQVLETGLGDLKKVVDKTFSLQVKLVRALEIFIDRLSGQTTETIHRLRCQPRLAKTEAIL